MAAQAQKDDAAPLAERVRRHLWPWQIEYLEPNRWVVVNKSRNVGYTWIALYHAVEHCLQHDGHAYYLATTKLDKAREELVRPIRNRILPTLDRMSATGLEWSATRARVDFPNGSTIYGVANEVDQMRGPTRASYLLDECASWDSKHLDDLEDAIFPIIRERELNPHGTLRMVSTPKPTDSVYRRAWEGDDPKWSRQGVDIYEACATDSFPNDDPQTYRSDCRTEGQFEQEYCQIFRDVSGDYFSRGELMDDRSLHEVSGREVAGVDFGKTHDRTEIVRLKAGDGEVGVCEVRELEGVSYERQREVVCDVLKSWGVAAAAVDAGGHPALAEWVVTEVPSCVGLTGDRERKVRDTQNLKGAVESGRASLTDAECMYMGGGDSTFTPIDDDLAVDHLTKVQEGVTTGGRLTFTAPRDEDGHADVYSAILLGMAAARFATSRSSGSAESTDTTVAYQQGWQ